MPTLNIVQDNQKGTKQPVVPQQKPQTANEKRGILGNILPVGGTVAGGILGGIGGEIIDPIGGGLPGAIAGSGLGSAAGEVAQQGIENLQGTRKGIDVKQGQSAGVGGELLEVGGRAIAPVAKGVFRIAAYLGNVDDQLMVDALKNSKLYVPGFKGGSDFLESVVKKIGDNLGKYSSQVTEKMGQMLKPIADIPIQGGEEAVNGLVGKVTKMLTERNMTPSGMAATTKQFIGDIPLNFEGKIPSSVINQGERKAVQTAYNLVNGLREEVPTASKLNAVKQTINELWNNMSDGSAKKLVGSINHEVGSFIDEFHPQLSAVRQTIKPAEKILNTVRSIVPQKSGETMTGQEIDAAKNALLNLYNTSTGATKKALEDFGSAVGTDLKREIGGVKLGGTKLSGMAKLPPGSVAQAESKFGRLIPQEIAKLPVRFASVTDFVSKLYNSNIGENTIRTILNALYRKNKQNNP